MELGPPQVSIAALNELRLAIDVKRKAVDQTPGLVSSSREESETDKTAVEISYRQLKLLESEITIQFDERVRSEIINALADLLLEALGAMPGESAEARNESEE